jgi:hypothetical protein
MTPEKSPKTIVAEIARDIDFDLEQLESQIAALKTEAKLRITDNLVNEPEAEE